MRSIRDYINLVTETDLIAEKVTLPADPSQPVQTQTVNGVTSNAPANSVQTGSGGVLKSGSGAAVTSGTPAPDPNAVAAAKAKLTPSQLKWLGGADPTDKFIMARMPKPQPGEVVPGQGTNFSLADIGKTDDRNEMDKASDAAAAAANPTNPSSANAVNGSDLQSDQTTAAATPAGPSVNAQGQNVTMPDGTNPETGQPTQTAAAPGGQAAQPANRDAMPFGQAFADARAKGEKEFTWKGKKYAVQMAKPAGQAAQPKKQTVGQQPMQQQAATAAGTAPQNVNPQGMAFGGGGLEEGKDVGYDEIQRLVSLVHHR